MSRRIVLTGGAGLVGQNLVPLLLARGDRVAALDKHETNLALLARLNPTVEAHRVDLSSAGGWDALFAGADAVLDLKAQIASLDEEAFRRNNVETEGHILEACRAHAIPHLIHASSSVVISVAQDLYSESKREAERLVCASGLPYTIFRPALMYGCFDVKHLGHIVRVLARTPVLPIPGSGRFLRQPVYVRDFCAVLLSALERGPSGGVHNIIGQERIDFIDILRTLVAARGWRRLILPLPIPLFSLLLRLYAVVARRPVFTPEQLEALTAGDDFPVDDWPAAFGVRYTPFQDAVRAMVAAPEYRFTWEMVSPH